MQKRLRSVADALCDATQQDIAGRSPAERIDLALLLGDADTRIFASARQIPEEQAQRQLARHRQHGRRRSACHELLLS